MPRNDGNDGKTPRAVTKIYAELVSNHPLPLDIPPLKVLINEQIATTTADSLKNSEVLAHNLAKSLILDFLTPQNAGAFGTIIRRMLSFEYTLQSTRNLLFWSLKIPSVTNTFKNNSSWVALTSLESTFIKSVALSNIASWIGKDGFSTLKFGLTSVIQQPQYSIIPLTQISVDMLPSQKVNTKPK